MSKSFFDGMLDTPSSQPEAKPKFFGQGGTGRAIAGYIGDYLYRMGGGGGSPYQDAVQSQHQQESILARALQEAQLRRQEFDYERANPKPAAPHYWETNDGSLGMIGADGKPSIAYQDPTKKIDWIQVKDPATGAISIMSRPQGGAPVGPITAPVGKLTPIAPGGASPSGSRTFR